MLLTMAACSPAPKTAEEESEAPPPASGPPPSVESVAVPTGTFEAWPEDQWNPLPSDGDFSLPGPCGSRFAFRRVETPVADGWMADIRVRLGNSGAEASDQPYAQFVRQEYVVGGLSDDDAADARYFWLGKYEVTAAQYDAVMSGACPELGWESSIAQQKTSWFDAVAFTRRLTEWVWENSPDSLPSVGETAAYIRLPTEVEWEYAARGGNAVSVEARNSRVFPMPDGSITDYAMHSGSRSCQGEVQPIGLIQPNPLDLYDMLGNVQEYVLDPFRPTSAERRLHGQTGGALAKGGSCMTNSGDLTTGMRSETLLYSQTGEVNAAPFTGFRLAIAAPALTSPRRIDAFEDGWADSREARNVPEGLGPAETIRAIAESDIDPDTAERLRDAAAAFDGEIATRRAIEARSLRTALMTGAMLVRSYRTDARLLARLEVVAQSDPETFADDLAGARDKVDKSRDIYVELLSQTADDYAAEIIASQAELVAADLDQRYAPPAGGGLTLGEMAQRFADQALRYQREAPSDLTDYFDDLMKD